MNEKNPLNPQDEQDFSPADSAFDIELDEAEMGDDLQAAADEAAQLTQPGDKSDGSLEALAQAQKRIAELEKGQVDQADKHHRLLADFANHRNRTGRDIQMAVTLAERKLLLEILPVVDSFERCISSTYSSVEDFHNGITLIHKQFQEALRKVGVEGVDLKVGDPFDAMHAEALTTIHQADLPDGAVANIYERGYMLRSELLRPARVVVNHNDQAEASQEA
jgi:molecular chaperone GrpE